MTDGPACFRQDFSCLAVLRIPLDFTTISVTGLAPSPVSLSMLFSYHSSCLVVVLQPQFENWFGLLRFRSPLLTESFFIFFSSGYLDVSVPRVPFLQLCIGCRIHEVCSCGFPHSDISGSRDICSSPKLIAAYHVFHRLLVPRHPPCALIA